MLCKRELPGVLSCVIHHQGKCGEVYVFFISSGDTYNNFVNYFVRFLIGSLEYFLRERGGSLLALR